MPLRFDATLKDIVAKHPDDFASLFGLPAKQPATLINVDLSTISAATDVCLGFGDPFREIIDLNFQSGPDEELPRRLHLYNAALHHRHAVPVRSDLIILRPKADAPNITGKLAYGDEHHRVEFAYGVIRLWQEPVDKYLHAGLAALPLATLCRMPRGRALPDALRDVVRAIDERLENEASHAEAVRLMTASYILAGLRVKKPSLFAIFQGVGMFEDSSAFEVFEDRGIIRGQIGLLLRQGIRRWGQPDAATKDQLSAIQDMDRLERLADAILVVNSWDDLLATP